MSKVTSAVMNDPLKFAIAAAVVAGVAYFLVRTLAKQAGGLVTGSNAITSGTPYEGAGIVATPAAIADAASGGVLSRFGSWLGSSIYDLTHEEYDPNTGLQTGAKTVQKGAQATDALWGRTGQVRLVN